MSETLARASALCDSLERVGAVTLTSSMESLHLIMESRCLEHGFFTQSLAESL